jgi:hypothetical protein
MSPSALTNSTPPSPVEASESCCVPGDSNILQACAADLEVLNQAKDLCTVIAQVESGEVAHVCMLYGPQKGRKMDPFWTKIKVKVTCRERVYEQLTKEFDGDKGRFFLFFCHG